MSGNTTSVFAGTNHRAPSGTQTSVVIHAPTDVSGCTVPSTVRPSLNVTLTRRSAPTCSSSGGRDTHRTPRTPTTPTTTTTNAAMAASDIVANATIAVATIAQATTAVAMRDVRNSMRNRGGDFI